MRDQERFHRALAERIGSATTALEGSGSEQLSFAALGQPLSETTFLAVDLETTGTGAGAEITEIGAVKVRGGEVLGEFQSLVRPGSSVITPYVASLTGITNSMVAGAPPLTEILPSFLEFAYGSVWVAHNAPFDIGFLKRACQEHDYRWPRPVVLDTVKIARIVLSREEVRNHKLSTLAAHFSAATTPDHRALSDARATVDVLHGLISRLGPQGVFSLEELRGLSRAVSPRQRGKHRLAEDLPTGPGVYIFVDAQRRPLYIGTSQNIRARVKQYFTSSETRSRMGEMVALAHSVRAVPCATTLEAGVRELRLIAEHKPPYNRRSRHPERMPWLVLTEEAFPRLSVVARPPNGANKDGIIGPFGSRRSAQAAKRALESLTPVRSCAVRIRADLSGFEPCAAAQVHRCGGPCAGVADARAYADSLEGLRRLCGGEPSRLWEKAQQRMSELARAERFEDAAALRDGALSACQAASTALVHGGLGALPLIVAAAPEPSGAGWGIAVVRHGRLAAAAHASARADVRAAARSAVVTAEHVPAPRWPDSAALHGETAMLERWLSSGQARLLEIAGTWSLPASARPPLAPRWEDGG